MENSENPFLAGQVLLFDKPYRKTSFEVVKKVRYFIKKKYNLRKIKVGHAGTLDPLATGLLILCTGKKTKEITNYQAQEKEYTGVITLGATTPSFDLETEIDQTYSIDEISEEAIYKTAISFIGQQLQVPPTFSAKWIDGKRAYEYARAGEAVELKRSPIEIHEFEITKIELPNVHFRIKCSKGTYIRAIARDFGLVLKNGGHLTELRRTKIGDFKVEDAISVNVFEEMLNAIQ